MPSQLFIQHWKKRVFFFFFFFNPNQSSRLIHSLNQSSPTKLPKEVWINWKAPMEFKVSSHQINFNINSLGSDQKITLTPRYLTTVLFRKPVHFAWPAYSNLYIEVSLHNCEKLDCLQDTVQELQALFNCHLSYLNGLWYLIRKTGKRKNAK